MALMLVGAVAVAGALAGQAREAFEQSCDLGALRPVDFDRTSFVFAADGSPLGAVPSPRNRQPVSLRQVSPWVVRATVAIEDRRFWEHSGVDAGGILRVALANVTSRAVVQGGSTITQQLVRRLYIDDTSVTVRRKLTEACLALKLESAWSKHRVLLAYLNTVFYGAARTESRRRRRRTSRSARRS